MIGYRTVFKIILVLTVTSTIFGEAFGDEVTLKWDKSDTEEVTGYGIFMKGEGESYPNEPWARTAGLQMTVTDVPGNKVTYFVARAYVDMGYGEVWSGDSNEVVYKPRALWPVPGAPKGLKIVGVIIMASAGILMALWALGRRRLSLCKI